MQTIVVGFDGSDTARLAVEEAARLARAFGGQLHVVNVVNNDRAITGMVTTAEQQTAEELAEVTTEEVLRLPASQGGLAEAVDGVFTRTRMMVGPAAGSMLEYADEVNADLIVVGNRRVRGIERLLGSVAIEILRRSPCSVYVAHTV